MQSVSLSGVLNSGRWLSLTVLNAIHANMLKFNSFLASMTVSLFPYNKMLTSTVLLNTYYHLHAYFQNPTNTLFSIKLTN